MRNWVKLYIIIILQFSGSAFSQEAAPAKRPDDFPRPVAVYVTGGVTDNEKAVFGAFLLTSLINSGACVSHENSVAFLATLDERSKRQVALDDKGISEIGRSFGIKYVCVASISPAFGEPGAFTVFARMLNTETEKFRLNGEATGTLKTNEELSLAANTIVEKMLGRRAPPPQAPPGEQVVIFDPPPPMPFLSHGEPEPADVVLENKATAISAHEASGAGQGIEPGPLGADKTRGQPALRKTVLRSVAVSLDVLGALAFAYGYAENNRAEKLRKEDKQSKAQKAEKRRDTAYITGGALLVSGITIHIFF
ncbi:MAG: hypothetical protein LBC59_02260 [Chitinispirillales bacterium]|jgi:hypothetical protein|nr:hypothetical protein [Chitinispirillales bacterium]